MKMETEKILEKGGLAARIGHTVVRGKVFVEVFSKDKTVGKWVLSPLTPGAREDSIDIEIKKIVEVHFD